MSTARVISKGQGTVPKVVQHRLGLRLGHDLEFVEEVGVFRIRKPIPPEAVSKWRAYLKDLAGKDVDGLVREMRGN